MKTFIQFIIATLVSLPSFGTGNYLNIYGNKLKSCSEPNSNMALTGYTRSGSCVEYQDDSGSHHICIDLSSTNGGDFCTVTGQSDWCSSYMTCDNDEDDDSEDLCPIQNWCVCQWAFASYIAKAGGCDYIQDIKCNAINIEALKAYKKLAGGAQDVNGKYTNALRCLESRCNVKASNLGAHNFLYVSMTVLLVFCVLGLIFRKEIFETSIKNNSLERKLNYMQTHS